MTRRLVEARAFAEDPLIVVDVGARGGIESFWKVFGDDIRTIAFEPDPEECARLQAIAEKNVTYLPTALGAESGRRTLHVARFSAASSFYPNDKTWCARFDIGDSLAIELRTEVRTTTLREALAGRQPDFIKLDVEGAELDVLRGADLGAVLGLVSEVRFSKRMSGCPTFAELDAFCRTAGFELYDLDLYRYTRRALPYPYLYDYCDDAGQPVPGPTVQGQPLIGDALYFRDGTRDSKAREARLPVRGLRLERLRRRSGASPSQRLCAVDRSRRLARPARAGGQGREAALPRSHHPPCPGRSIVPADAGQAHSRSHRRPLRRRLHASLGATSTATTTGIVRTTAALATGQARKGRPGIIPTGLTLKITRYLPNGLMLPLPLAPLLTPMPGCWAWLVSIEGCLTEPLAPPDTPAPAEAGGVTTEPPPVIPVEPLTLPPEVPAPTDAPPPAEPDV